MITQRDIGGAVLHTLETKPLPSAAARAYEVIRPSVVRVRGLGHHGRDEDADTETGVGRIKPSGYLILYAPHKELYPNVGQEGSNPDHKHDFMPEDILEVMKDVGGWDLVRNETRAEDREYSFFQVYKRLQSDKHRFSYKDPRPEKTAAVIRYGAFGDLIQASSVFAGLKEQGYHVTLYTSENGYQVAKNDPHVDKFVVQFTDQVPNHLLGEFWASIKKKYDKFVNLSESVEGSLLAISWKDSSRMA